MEIINDLNQCKNKILENIFNFLNDKQKEAVFQVNGPLLILAGAGSGKTTVLINRIFNLIKFGDSYNNLLSFTSDEENLINSYCNSDLSDANSDQFTAVANMISYNTIKPWNILAITFTNKAASEIKERLHSRLGDIAQDVNAGTFHWMCGRILRKDIERLGYKSNFTVYDTGDTKTLIKICMDELKVEKNKITPSAVRSIISNFKNRLITPEQAKTMEETDENFKIDIAAQVYERYQQRLVQANALDFDDMILLTVKLFQENPDILEYYQNRYKYIMVDEYQDTNYAQYLLIKLLAEKYKNICVVGDDDQSIYKFRGADIKNILGFENDFPNAKIIRLEQNYRSSQNILNSANSLIKNNTMRKGKELWTENESGDKLTVRNCQNEVNEAKFIRQIIEENVANGAKYSDHVILYRMNVQSNAIERDFSRAGIPHRILGGLRFYERKEIKDIMSYLAIINNPNDSVRLRRIINEPKRGIGDATINTIEQIADGLGIGVFEVLKNTKDYPLLSRKSRTLSEFAEIIEQLIEKAKTLSLIELYKELIELSGYAEYLKSQGIEGETRYENIEELSSNIAYYMNENPEGTLAGFLEEVALISDIDNYDADADAVTMMTIHASKGLEFPIVFIVGMEEGIFPKFASYDIDDLEEERRLAYVAITRAKRNVYISTVNKRMLFGKTSTNKKSRFIKEISEEYINYENEVLPVVRKPVEKIEKKKTTISEWTNTPVTNISKNKYASGEKVKHKLFGTGVIESVTPMGNDNLLEISFGNGTKKVMANFSKLDKID